MKDLSLHIYDIVQNAIRAQADEIHINISEDREKNVYTIQIKDNGMGIPDDLLKKVDDAFYTTRTTRKVGLGLPLLKQHAEQANGWFAISSELNCGTTVTATFMLDHIDRPYAGDMVSTTALLIATNPEINMVYKHVTVTGDFYLSTMDIREAIGDVPVNMPEVIGVVKQLIAHNLEKIRAETSGINRASTKIIMNR